MGASNANIKPNNTNMEMLKRTYFGMLLPPVAVMILVRLNSVYQWVYFEAMDWSPIAAAVIFVLAVISAVALPIFLRAQFAHQVRERQHVPSDLFFRFQHRLLIIVLITPYLALMTQLIRCPRFFAAATIILSLYGVYYYYPSIRRIQFDQRLFRVQ